MHVSAVRPLRYRLRAQIYEILLIRPPASAVFFRAPHAFSSLHHRSPPCNDRGQKWPKAVKTGAQGEAFTRNTLYFKRLCVNQREHRLGEAFTRNTLTLNILQAKSEEVKAKSRKTPDARASRVRVGRSPCAGRCPSWAGGEKTPLGAPPSREKIVTSQSAPLRSSRGSAHPPKTSQSEPSFFPFSP